MISSLFSTVSRLSALSHLTLQTSVAFASGRWWPQPILKCSHRWYAVERYSNNCESAAKNKSLNSNVATTKASSTNLDASCFGSAKSLATTSEHPDSVQLNPEKAAPVYAPPRYTGVKVFGTVVGEGGELLADYVLFEESIQRSKVPWVHYTRLSSAERDIYMAHLKAVKQHKLTYVDPNTGFTVMTISKLLLAGKCCGNGCRHCPYDHENMDPVKRKKMKFNGYELSRHRSRPPVPGIHRRTRLVVVDNSELGKEANLSGKLAYCIHVYKQGYRKKHMPHAILGDKVLVAIRGEMRKAFVVGANTHVLYRKHGIPSTDTNNIVLLNTEGNPEGTRILAPIPSKLLLKRNHMQFSKVLALATKFV
uniref:Large ribosomal subunit protein uL14m n=1 Tax=Syphacia muris TaxID=451379 RepID=A0A0N5AXE0_9BILA